MGDTEHGTWGSGELGRHIEEERAAQTHETLDQAFERMKASALRVKAERDELLAALDLAFDELDVYWKGDYAGRPLAQRIKELLTRVKGEEVQS